MRKYVGEVSHSANEWLLLFNLLDFTDEPPLRPEVVELVESVSIGAAPRGGLRAQLTPLESMRVAFAKARAPPPDWDTLCKVSAAPPKPALLGCLCKGQSVTAFWKAVLACNISDLDPSKGLHALLGGGEAEVLCQLSAFRHTPEVSTALLPLT